MAPAALVTGGSSGIGLEAAAALLRRGYAVALVARRIDQLEAARDDLIARFGPETAPRILLRPHDVADHAAAAALVADVEATLGPVDFLLAAAGMVEPGLFVEQPLATHLRQIEVNYGGALVFAAALAPRMAARGRGHIVFVSSAAAFVGLYGYAGYGASKFALRGLAESLRPELAPAGVGVAIAFPPDTDTPQHRGEAGKRPAVTRRIAAMSGLARPEAVAEDIVAKALAGRFVITQGAGLALFALFHSLLAAPLRAFQTWLARRSPD
ncbi:MAG: SDR family NAD(P)-dependent oxidoreductase [Methylobacteriaceae bacterium]|nr:SDR family NAD(P)-dependent oxidoreductase [Methylobacteriaceae bacterium]